MLGAVSATCPYTEGLLLLLKPSFIQPDEGALELIPFQKERKRREMERREGPGLSLGGGRGEQLEDQTPRR